jgi:glycolate oxidase FAD binding subunit
VQQAKAAAELLNDAELVEHDDPLWEAQREAQRSPEGLVVKVSALQTDLPELLQLARDHGAMLAGRAGLGLHWLRLDDGDHLALVEALRRRWTSAVLDRPAGLEVDRDGPMDPGARLLAERVKERFDPSARLV